MLSESSTSDEERRRSGSNDRVTPERQDLTMVGDKPEPASLEQ